MARPRSPLYDHLREQIYQAALHLFVRRGFLGTSMNDVAAACSVSKPLIYHYFAHKQLMLQEMVERHLGHHEDLVSRLAAEDLSARDRLREYVRRFCSGPYELVAMQTVIRQDCVHLDNAPRVATQARLRAIHGFLADAVSELVPEVTRPTCELMAEMLVSACQTTRLAEPGRSPLQAELIARTVVAGVESLATHSESDVALGA